MAEEHDKTHRLIFAFPRMIEDLLRLILGGKWLERLDFSTLEKVPERLQSPELLRREQDVFWRLVYSYPEGKKFDSFYLYVHIEHQSRPRRKMSVITTGYKLLALQDLGYHLIDARRQPLEEILEEDSPLVGLFQLTQARAFEDLVVPAKKLSALLGPEDEELRQAFVTMINEEIYPRLAGKDEKPQRITDLEEFPTMLEQTMDGIIRRLEMKGEARGEARGEANLFQELFMARYGDLPDWVCKRIAEAKKGQIMTWAKRLLTSERPEDVFD